MSDPIDDETAGALRVIAGHCSNEPMPFGLGIIMPSNYCILNGIRNNVSDRYEVVQFAVHAMNFAIPLLDDRDRLKGEVAALEGILGDAAHDSPDTPRVLQLEARVRELEEALRPFAECGRAIQESLDRGGWPPSDREGRGREILRRHPKDDDMCRAAKVLEGRTDG